MVEWRRTERFAPMAGRPADVGGRARIQARIERLQRASRRHLQRLARECRVADRRWSRVSRVFHPTDAPVIILLAGGSKHTQTADIRDRLQLRARLSE